MSKQSKYAIRFGLGAIKAVGIKMMENAVIERQEGGNFKDLYDFASRLDSKSINKKSIEALAKAGAFDSIEKNRRKIAESYDILSNYAQEQKEQNESNQMNLFGETMGFNSKPELKNVEKWNKPDRLHAEFEAFGFFLNEHPIDDFIEPLKKRGVVFSDRIEDEDLEDNSLIKIAGVVCASKHRSGSRGRFAYMTMSDPFGIFEAMIFDEALINSSRDLISDGTLLVLECLIKKDEGGTRILTRSISKLEEFIQNNEANKEVFEDIKKQRAPRKRNFPNTEDNAENQDLQPTKISKEIISNIEIIIKDSKPIMPLKSFLSQNQSFDETKTSKVIIAVLADGKFSKIELSKKYLLDRNDIQKIRSINSVIDVEIS